MDTKLRATTVRDTLDVSLVDQELREEVELTTHLIIAITESDGPLTQEMVDRFLGL